MGSPRVGRLLPWVLATWLLATGCSWLPLELRPASAPLRISEVADEGDAERRASTRLVLEGLDADEDGDPERALSSYELALQVDPTNPWAYIALARHHADGVDPRQALPFLDQAHALLLAQGASSPRADAVLLGLRGQALVASGRYEEGIPWLERAREQSPDVWSDGRLSAAELR